MKIAIVCDWLITLGGAERVLKELLTLFPNADIFSTLDFLSDQDKQRLNLSQKLIQTSFLQKLPFSKKYYRQLLPLMPFAIEQFDLGDYDLVISSSHAIAKGIIPHPNQLHISYVHSPMRYAWDFQFQYLKQSKLDKAWYGWIARYLLHKLRTWDALSSLRVDHFIANSKFIAKRIEKAYKRKSTVIHPPVDNDFFSYDPSVSKSSFYLAAGRLVAYKRFDLIVDAFNQMPDKKLLIVGCGEEFKKLKAHAAPSIQFITEASDAELRDYLRQARAFIFAAQEDFGILPLEAQGCGTPVIAYGQGGALETINPYPLPNPTGLFFQEQSSAAIQEAIHLFEAHESEFKPDICEQHARQFSPAIFRQHIQSFCDEVIQSNQI